MGLIEPFLYEWTSERKGSISGLPYQFWGTAARGRAWGLCGSVSMSSLTPESEVGSSSEENQKGCYREKLVLLFLSGRTWGGKIDLLDQRIFFFLSSEGTIGRLDYRLDPSLTVGSISLWNTVFHQGVLTKKTLVRNDGFVGITKATLSFCRGTCVRRSSWNATTWDTKHDSWAGTRGTRRRSGERKGGKFEFSGDSDLHRG